MKHQLHITNTKGGSKIVFVDVPGSSSYYFNTICNGGYNYAQKEKYELPHLLEHLAFEGTSNYPDASKMYYELERLGGWSNASTSEQNIRYFLVGSIKDYRAISALALEQYTRPLFRAKNIKEQKQVVEREFKRQIDDDGTRVRALNYTRFFPDKISFPKDSITTLKNITRGDILDFYKTTHTQANTLFVIAGDLNSKRRQEISLMVEKAMQPLPRGKKLRKFHSLATDELTKSKALASKLEGQANFSMAFIIPDYLEDIKSRAIMAVASAIYNRGDSSRIFRKAREAGLAYTVDSGIYSGPDYGELYIIDKTDPKLTAKLLDLCLKELVDITKGNISNAELERAKGYMAGEYDTEYETSREIANWYGPQFAADEPIFSPQDFSNAIRSVQKTDVIKMLHKFVRPDNWIFGLVANSPQKLLKTCEQAIAKNLATLS